MTSVVVAQLYRVIHDGAAYPPGAIATVPDDVTQRWLTAGWVELAPARPPNGGRTGTPARTRN
jgi:hypothetical protein